MKKAVIWGCGNIGKMVYRPLIDCHNIQIVAYTDSSADLGGGVIYNTPVIPPKELDNIEYDYVFIALNDFDAIKDIYEQLMRMNISADKIKSIALETEFMDTCMDQRTNWIHDFANWIYEQNLNGCVAECGVFRGDSAKYINKFFPDKKMYLFDTFEGFDQADTEYELEINSQNHNIHGFKEYFTHTNLDLMMKKMEYPNNIEIRKGYFPETAVGIEDSFVFVNMDMDLYQPMLGGLNFFYDRIVEGGCILLHDFFNKSWPGVKKAVHDFEAERNIYVKKVPIGDGCSIVLIK